MYEIAETSFGKNIYQAAGKIKIYICTYFRHYLFTKKNSLQLCLTKNM